MQVQTSGEFGGLGIEVTMENGLVKVVSPIDDTPAAEPASSPATTSPHIDGERVTGLPLNEAVEQDARPGRHRDHAAPSCAKARRSRSTSRSTRR